MHVARWPFPLTMVACACAACAHVCLSVGHLAGADHGARQQPGDDALKQAACRRRAERPRGAAYAATARQWPRGARLWAPSNQTRQLLPGHPATLAEPTSPCQDARRATHLRPAHVRQEGHRPRKTTGHGRPRATEGQGPRKLRLWGCMHACNAPCCAAMSCRAATPCMYMDVRMA